MQEILTYVNYWKYCMYVSLKWMQKYTQAIVKSYDLGVKHNIFFMALGIPILQTVIRHCTKKTLLCTISQ